MIDIHCHYCRGHRPTRSGICLGCSSDAAECASRRPKYRRRCPKCTDGLIRVIGASSGIVCCDTCGFDGYRREL